VTNTDIFNMSEISSINDIHGQVLPSANLLVADNQKLADWQTDGVRELEFQYLFSANPSSWWTSEKLAN
jgi:hypothetical protein